MPKSGRATAKRRSRNCAALVLLESKSPAGIGGLRGLVEMTPYRQPMCLDRGFIDWQSIVTVL